MSAKATKATTTEQTALRQDSRAEGPAAATSLCATCHQPLLSGGSEAACPRCLANFLAAPAGDLPADPNVGEPAARQAPRYGHFEMLIDPAGLPLELGRGAMGITYRARDTVLNRAVALKVIDRSVAEHPAARTRFLREARAAAQFQHPNVAAVSHYGEQDGECFYAMELVEGETLETRVRRDGPLPARLTLEIAVQVARALAAAEVRGVIHRDLKPTNLMLAAPEGEAERDGTPVVKVIDFGLAKAVTAAAQATEASETRGGFVGSPAFASPEQFDRSENARIDHRSDIYSLGTTLWYALSGQVPFVGRTLEEMRERRADALPQEQLAAQAVPRPVIALLASMLAVDPAARPQSARALLEALGRCREQLPAARGSSCRGRTRQWAGAGILLLLAAVAASIWWMYGRTPAAPPGRSIAVLPFQNLSPKADDAFYATGVQDGITADLGRVAALKVISPDSANQYPPGKRNFARIGSELGVQHLLTGSVRRAEGRVRIEVRLIDPENRVRPWTVEYNRELADSVVLESEIARAVADRLQTPLSNEEKAAIDRPPTTDQVAYDLYLQAKNNITLSAGTAQARSMYGRSQTLLEQATQRDPKFALAYCVIAYIQDELASLSLDATPEESAVDHRALAESALLIARRLQPDAGEVHLAEANHLASIVHDFAQAKIETDLARQTLPNNAELESIAARVAENTGHWEEATRARERAVVLDPRDPGNYAFLEQNYRMLRRYNQADVVLRHLIALTPAEDALPVQLERATEILESRADLAPLRAALSAAPSGEEPAEVNVFRFLLAYFDRDAAGLARAIAAAPQRQFHLYLFFYPKVWFEALKERLRGDQAGEMAAFTLARGQEEELLRADSTSENAGAMSLLAMIDAALGRKDEAVREGLHACAMLPETTGATEAACLHCNLAVVYAWTGQADLAIAELETWIKKPAGAAMVYQPTYGDLKLNPMWDPLRSDKRFEAIVEQLAPAPLVKTAGK